MKTSSVISAKPQYWDKASRTLMKRDRILNRLIPEYATEGLRQPRSAFGSMARIIISQQLSTKAASKMWKSFKEDCGVYPCAESVLKLARQEQGLKCLPKRKAGYITGLAEHFSEQGEQLPCWKHLDDESVINKLCKIRGVGRWSAEMFLIFNLHRPNILPLEDASLLKAISLHYFSGEPVSRFEAREVAQAWDPWCTVATWYLWRSLDPVAVRH